MASSLIQPQSDPSKEDNYALEKSDEVGSITDTSLNLDKSEKVNHASLDEYVQLQRRIFLATLIVSALVVSISVIFFDSFTSVSLLIGAFSGVVYLRLLARSIGKLGKSSKSVGKVQLLIPVLLVLAVSRLPQLGLFPSLIGFLLYKPSLIIQAMLESSSKSKTSFI